MIDRTILTKIKSPIGDDEDTHIDIMQECYEVIDNLSGNEEIVEFIDLVINNDTAFQYLFAIFLGLRGCLDNSPMTLASFGLVPTIGNINDPMIQEAMNRLINSGKSNGITIGLSEDETSEMFRLK